MGWSIKVVKVKAHVSLDQIEEVLHFQTHGNDFADTVAKETVLSSGPSRHLDLDPALVSQVCSLLPYFAKYTKHLAEALDRKTNAPTAEAAVGRLLTLEGWGATFQQKSFGSQCCFFDHLPRNHPLGVPSFGAR